ncbi:MAG: class C beta-lactamase-related serine hydrolase [Mesorhizobium sp.]|nr:serine hydrolase [Mesorhizobium sp.]RWC53217.1 MAG: class C beta-lactamase-related serine hydrolase [Mesorhizobium sp.]RWC54006.1 MAG: class C beta-lactamase-related serine hydrolase [Mesorhizobium sp.]
MGMLELDGQRYLDGHASDPRELGWMRGAPPPADKRITFESDCFRTFPQIRWSLSHMRELTTTVNVWRGPDEPSKLERLDRTTEIDALAFTDANGRSRRFEEALFDTYADGILVLHRGRIVYERYFGSLEPHLPHACHSVTKSYVGTLAAAFVHEGVLDDGKAIPYYLPELQGSAWEDATLRQVMDMQTGLAHAEVYADENSDLWDYARACGFRPQLAGYSGPKTMCDYLQTIRKKGAHGGSFEYLTVNTEIVAWVMSRVTGHSFAQLLQERLWAPLGCEDDANIIVDSAGMPMAGGGLSTSLRDLARFGEMIRQEGEWNGRQILPASVIADIRRGGDRAKFTIKGMPGYSYRSMWWVPHDEFGAIEAQGIHGQRLYVAPGAEMVIAQFASHPLASTVLSDVITVPQMLELGRLLHG